MCFHPCYRHLSGVPEVGTRQFSTDCTYSNSRSKACGTLFQSTCCRPVNTQCFAVDGPRKTQRFPTATADASMSAHDVHPMPTRTTAYAIKSALLFTLDQEGLRLRAASASTAACGQSIVAPWTPASTILSINCIAYKRLHDVVRGKGG